MPPEAGPMGPPPIEMMTNPQVAGVSPDEIARFDAMRGVEGPSDSVLGPVAVYEQEVPQLGEAGAESLDPVRETVVEGLGAASLLGFGAESGAEADTHPELTPLSDTERTLLESAQPGTALQTIWEDLYAPDKQFGYAGWSPEDYKHSLIESELGGARPDKLIGYESLDTAAEAAPDLVGYVDGLADRGMQARVYSQEEGGHAGGTLFSYRPVELQALLDSRRDVLTDAEWPLDAAGFVDRVATENAPPGPLFDLVADAFADFNNTGRTDGGKGPNAIDTSQWEV